MLGGLTPPLVASKTDSTRTMAGTRLLVHSIFFGQLVLLIAAALYFGLCQRGDLVCVPLFQQDGRALLLQGDSETVLSESLTFPPVTLISADSQAPFWNDALRRIQLDGDRIVVQKDTAGHLQASCSDPTIEHAANHEVWLCEHFRTREQPRLVVRNGTSFFYPTSLSRRVDELKSLYPRSLDNAAAAVATRVSSLHLVLAVDSNRTDWKLWMAAVNEWMVASRFQEWPCLAEPPKIHVQVVDWSEKIRPVVVNDNNATTTSYRLLLHDNMLPGPPHDGSSDSSTNTWYATVYVPSQYPLKVEMDAAVVGRDNNHVMTVISRQPENNSDHGNLTRTALESITEWMVTKCMGLPAIADSDSDTVVWDSDGSFPQWYLQLWYQRVLRAQHHDTVSMIRRERQLLLEKPRTVAITVQVAASWQKAVASIQQAVEQSSRGDYGAALQSLDGASHEIKSQLQTQPQLGPPLDFPLDQYAAIFAPLLVPLLLPLLAGMVREVKRYRSKLHK